MLCAKKKTSEKQFSAEHDAITKAQTALQEKAKKVETDSGVMSKERLAKEAQAYKSTAAITRTSN